MKLRSSISVRCSVILIYWELTRKILHATDCLCDMINARFQDQFVQFQMDFLLCCRLRDIPPV